MADCPDTDSDYKHKILPVNSSPDQDGNKKNKVMSVLKVGAKFFESYKDWLVLKRSGNYVLLEGTQAMTRTLWVCASVRKDENSNEICRPHFAGAESAGAIFYDKAKMESVFDSEVQKMKDVEIRQKKEAESVKKRTELVALHSKKHAEFKALKVSLVEQMREIVRSKSVDSVLKDKSLTRISDDLFKVELILNNWKS